MEWMKERAFILVSAGIVILCFGFAMLVGGKARAADLGRPDLVDVAPVKSIISGIYIGGAGGLTSASTEVSAGPFSIDGLGSQGLTAEMIIGFDIRLTGSPIVLGAYGKYGIANTEFSVNPGIFSAKFTNQYAVGGRLGYAFSTAMPYVFLGYRHTDVDWSIPSPLLPSAFSGYEMGGGIEMALAKNLSLYGEGRYTRYQSETIAIGPGINLEPTELAALVGLKLRFNP